MKTLAVLGFFAQKVMRFSWYAEGLLFFPAMDGRFQLVTKLASVMLSVSLFSTIVFIVCLTLFKNSK